MENKELKQEIIKIWKEATVQQETKLDELCKKYHVKRKPVELFEEYTTYEFENGVKFSVPHDDCFEDFELSGDSLKFAEEQYGIMESTYEQVTEKLRKFGLIEDTQDEYYTTYIKNEFLFYVNHYAEKEDDIEIIVSEDNCKETPKTENKTEKNR